MKKILRINLVTGWLKKLIETLIRHIQKDPFIQNIQKDPELYRELLKTQFKCKKKTTRW